jgi:hypoxanthine-guanine phosphoribosyltransferase
MGFETLDATKPLGTHSFGLPVYVSSEMIDTQVENLALALLKRFPVGKMPVFVPVLRGGILFL